MRTRGWKGEGGGGDIAMVERLVLTKSVRAEDVAISRVHVQTPQPPHNSNNRAYNRASFPLLLLSPSYETISIAT
jgi:hypothetical protein